MSLTNIFKELDLSEKEAEVYKILLGLSVSSAQELAGELKMPRSTVYKILNQLEQKRLVESLLNKVGFNRFRAKHPFALKEYIENKRETISQMEAKLNLNFSDIISLYSQSQTRPGIKFYEGLEGIKKVLKDTLFDNPQKELMVFSDVSGYIKYLKDWNINYYAKQRVNLEINERGITPDNKELRDYLIEYPAKKYLDLILIDPKLYPFSVEINIYNNKVSFVTFSDREHIGVIIESPTIYRTLKSIFEMNWDLGKQHFIKYKNPEKYS